MRKTDEERTKPCGFAYYCPLVDEFRLFADAQEIMLVAGASEPQLRSLCGLTRHKWCQGQQGRGLEGDSERCHDVIVTAAEAFAQAGEAERVSYFAASLQRALGHSRPEPVTLYPEGAPF